MEERQQQFGAAPDPCKAALHQAVQLLHCSGGVIAQLLFDVTVAVLLRIEIRGIGGQQLDVDLWMCGQKLLHGLGMMDASPIPHHDKGTGEAAAQVAQEGDDMFPPNRVGVVEFADAPGGSQTHERGLLPASGEAAQAWSAGHRGPGRPQGREKREADLIDEDDDCPQAAGFFLIRGQSCWRHAAIWASSRSRACPAGFCRLHPQRRSSRRRWTILYQTPWVRPITVRIRPNVHRSVSNPNAIAPRRRTVRMALCWAALKAAGRPEARRARNPRSPAVCICLAHLLTAASLTPKWRAMAAWFRAPRRNKRPPARRRSAI
jgi:hypothetical protein